MKKILLILVTFICTTSIFAQNSFHESFKSNSFVQNEQCNYSQPNFKLMKNESSTTKQVWVDEGWGYGKMLGFGTGLTGTLIFGGLACLEFLHLTTTEGLFAVMFGLPAGACLISTIIALCIPNEGHWETVPISKIQNNPILSNIVFATNIQKTVVGYNINL